DPRSGLSKLETVSVTRDAADQRAGRAGRVAPGVCYRLWSKASHQFLQPARQPEILEADLAPLMLELFYWGTSAEGLKWFTPPPNGALNQAVDLLTQLGAVTENKITAKGKQMLRLPSHPRITHLLLSVEEEEAKALAADLAAVLEERDPLGKEEGADLSLRIEALRKWRRGDFVKGDKTNFERIEKLASQWRRILKVPTNSSVFTDLSLGKMVSEAYPERIAKQTEKFSSRYKLANGRMAKLHDHDGLNRYTWLAIASIDFGANEGKIFSAAPLDETDLVPIATENNKVGWDEERGIIFGQAVKQIGALTLSSKPITKIDEALRVKTLCNALRQEGLRLLNWEEPQHQWQSRVLSLRIWRPDENWPDVNDTWLLDHAEEWLAPYLSDVSNRLHFQKLDINSILSGLLPWEMQQQLTKLAPAALQVPSGSMIKIEYSAEGEAPIMKVRLQEVFGLTETPAINNGRTKIILHLLSPGYKPVQITQDLKNFWNTTYSEVRNEFKRQYPKHSWPEDPWNAVAVRGVKRK
ncbi:MAG TPA: ATP-dependent helicase HrpB, partial [Cytophagales bacterium]|nr:ATP-dependent helicase HrpB [Cytophagales bacterium]